MEQTAFLLTLAAFLWLQLGAYRLAQLERQGRLRINRHSWRTLIGCALWPWMVREIEGR